MNDNMIYKLIFFQSYNLKYFSNVQHIFSFKKGKYKKRAQNSRRPKT